MIYIGISIMDEYFGSGVESGVMGMLIGMLMAFATLSLATTIRDIVNPGGKGMFSGLGSMLTMAVAGGMMVASAGMGAVAGGAAAMGGRRWWGSRCCGGCDRPCNACGRRRWGKRCSACCDRRRASECWWWR